MEREEKLKALDAALGQIEKQFGKGAVMKLGDPSAQMNVETIPTGSLSLDIALGLGGIPKGRIIEIYGPESSGKTTVTLHMIAEVQKRGGIAGFIDAEHALDPVYAKNIGVDVDNLYISQPDNGEQALEIAEQLIRSSAIDRQWSVPAQLTLLLWIRLQLLYRRRRLTVIWEIPMWVCRRDSCPRHYES